MAKSFSDKLPEGAVAGTVSAMIAAPMNAEFKVLDGAALLSAGAVSPKLMLFGSQGSGKSYALVYLLRAGFKVLHLATDFGSTGIEATVINYFKNHPEEAAIAGPNYRPATMNVDGLFTFLADPASVIPDIYTWDPDWLVWDGITSYQMSDLERKLCGSDGYLRTDTDWKMWKQANNGTIFPLHDFLRLENRETGRQWAKIGTCLESEKATKVKKSQDSKGNAVATPVEGSEMVGPMLHTDARSMSNAGFDLVVNVTKRQVGMDQPSFIYKTWAEKTMVKQRGYGIPDSIEAEKFWPHIFAKMTKPAAKASGK